jgi:hypothetical protein
MNGSAAVIAWSVWFAMGTACVGNDGFQGDGLGGDEPLFDEPADFDRSDCGGEPPASIDPVGAWHGEIVPDDGSGNSLTVFRVDPGAGDELAGILNNEAADEVGYRDGDLFLRRESTVDDVTSVFAIDLCSVDEQGRLHGRMAFCYGEPPCYEGDVIAYAVRPLDEPEAEGMTLVSEWPGPAEAPWAALDASDVRHQGTAAFVLVRFGGLVIVDLTDPAAPADLADLPASPDESFGALQVGEVDGRVYAFLASTRRGVVVVDVTDPTDPVEVTAFPAPPADESGIYVQALFLDGTRLYVGGSTSAGMGIFDVSDPKTPVELGAYVDFERGSPDGISVRDGVAYLNQGVAGFNAVDVSDPAAPVSIGRFDGYPGAASSSNAVTEAGGRQVAAHSDEGLSGHVRIIDVDPGSDAAFEEIGAYQTRPQVGVNAVRAVGDRALVAYHQDGLRVIDLADPTDPTEVAHFDSWTGIGDEYGRGFFEGAADVDYDGERDLVLLVDSHRGLLVLTLDR